jgi:phage terminase large subunit
MMSTSDQVLLSGSFGAGKSRVGNEKGYLMNMMYPGNRGLIVRKHFSDVYSSTIKQPLLEEVIPDSPIHNHNKGEHVIEHYTGSYDDNGKPILSEIHYHGLDSGQSTSDDDLPRKIGSHSYGWIFVDEGTELSKGEWNQLQGRLRYKGTRQGGTFYTVPFQQIFTATNPASPQHWMYKLFFNADNQQDAHAIRMNVKDNPYVPKSYVERMEKNLSGMYYERYFLGKWVGAEGIIYSEYTEDDHLITADYLANPDTPLGTWDIKRTEEWDYNDEPDSVWIDPPEGWRVYRSIDFGYNNPFVCQWWALSPDDELVLFRELYQSELLVEDAGRRIEELTNDDWHLENTFADHDAEGNENLKRRGVHTANAKKDVNAGIQSVKNRLRKDDRGRPRLYIMVGSRVHKPDNRLVLDDSPTKTVDEIPSYVWKNDDEEVPRKADDHGLDALRYLTYSLDNGPNITLDEMKSLEETVNSAW